MHSSMFRSCEPESFTCSLSPLMASSSSSSSSSSFLLFLIQVVSSMRFRLLHPLLKSPVMEAPLPHEPFATFPRSKNKVVFILGATGSGKSKLAIGLATRFGGEVVNSDKMQVYDSLDVMTNKVTTEERGGVPHHLLGGVPPDADFTAADFRRAAVHAVGAILARGRVPIVAGGSNSYIEELVEGDGGVFRARHECCFLWVDVEAVALQQFVTERVERMVERGLVEEARAAFRRDGDYSRGIRRAIGVAELDGYFRAEEATLGEEAKARLLEAAIDEIKANTCRLTCCQLQKIRRFCGMGWELHRLDATEFFVRRGDSGGCGGEEALWEKVVGEPSAEITGSFLAAKI